MIASASRSDIAHQDLRRRYAVARRALPAGSQQPVRIPSSFNLPASVYTHAYTPERNATSVYSSDSPSALCISIIKARTHALTMICSCHFPSQYIIPADDMLSRLFIPPPNLPSEIGYRQQHPDPPKTAPRSQCRRSTCASRPDPPRS